VLDLLVEATACASVGNDNPLSPETVVVVKVGVEAIESSAGASSSRRILHDHKKATKDEE